MKMTRKVLVLLFNFLFLLGCNAKKDLQDDDTEDDVAEELLSKLTSSEVKVIAVGQVSGKITLFISGSSDMRNSYKVTVSSDPTEGRFDVDKAERMGDKYSNFKPAEVTFVCSDTSANLVTMSADNVWAFNIDQNKFEQLPIVPGSMTTCYQNGETFFSSSIPKFYYQLQSSGVFNQYHFDSETIASAGGCSSKKYLGHFCTKDTEVSVSRSCTDSPPAGIISGYVGESQTYLFDNSNNVYFFDSSVFKGGKSVNLTMVASSTAWYTPSLITTWSPNDTNTSTDEGFSTTPMIVFIILFIVVILISTFIFWYCNVCGKLQGDRKMKAQYNKLEGGEGPNKGTGKSGKKQGQKALPSGKSSSKKNLSHSPSSLQSRSSSAQSGPQSKTDRPKETTGINNQQTTVMGPSRSGKDQKLKRSDVSGTKSKTPKATETELSVVADPNGSESTNADPTASHQDGKSSTAAPAVLAALAAPGIPKTSNRDKKSKDKSVKKGSDKKKSKKKLKSGQSCSSRGSRRGSSNSKTKTLKVKKGGYVFKAGEAGKGPSSKTGGLPLKKKVIPKKGSLPKFGPGS